MNWSKVLFFVSVFSGILVISLDIASIIEPWYCYLKTTYTNGDPKSEINCIYLYQVEYCDGDSCETSNNNGSTLSVFTNIE